MGNESAGGAAQEKDIKTRRKNPVRTGDDSEPLVMLILFWVPERSLCVSDALKEETNHEEKIAGIILASVLTFSAMAGVQASAEDRLWKTVWRQMVEDDISQNQTEVKDDDDSTSEDNEENTENEGVDSPENDTEVEEDPSEAKEETEISFEEEQESIEAEVEENPEQELELMQKWEKKIFFMDNEKSLPTYAGSGIPVDWVGPNYKMRPEYAFTYAFRKELHSFLI